MASGLGVKKQRGTGLTVLLALACVVIIVTGLKAAGELFVPIMLGGFLALLSLPILNWVNDRGVPRPLAILLTVLVDMLIVGALVYLAIAVISQFDGKKQRYANILKDRAIGLSETVDKKLAEFSGFWEKFGVDLGPVSPIDPTAGPEPKPAPDLIDPATPTVPGSNPVPPSLLKEDGTHLLTLKEVFERYMDANRIVELIGQTDLIGKVTSLASKSFFVFIIMIFVLAESGGFSQKLKDVIHVRGPDLRGFQNSSRDIGKYLTIKTGVSALTGLLAWGACSALNVEFPEMWGLVAFLFNFIPAIGSIIAAVPPIVLALIESGFWPAFGVLVCFLVINVAIGNFLEPMLLGDRFGISTVMVIFSVLVWGYIWGPVGMFLAVPLTMMIKVLLDSSHDLRWISVLMGKRSDENLQERRKLARRVMEKNTETAPVAPVKTDTAPEELPPSSEGAAP